MNLKPLISTVDNDNLIGANWHEAFKIHYILVLKFKFIPISLQCKQWFLYELAILLEKFRRKVEFWRISFITVPQLTFYTLMNTYVYQAVDQVRTFIIPMFTKLLTK
jgi:hypothetical protein